MVSGTLSDRLQGEQSKTLFSLTIMIENRMLYRTLWLSTVNVLIVAK